MKKKILFLFVYLCVSLLSVAQNALCIYPRENVDSLPIAFRVFGRMTYSENSFDITHRGGWLLYTSPYDDVQHISFIEHQPTYTTVFDTICAGEVYTWNGIEYKKPGVYTDTLQNIYGCDSIVELRLEVLPDPVLTFTVNGVSFNMMRVRAGSFMMGATPEQGDDALANEKPAHQVTLTRDYFIAETMLTQELWTAVMGTTIQEEEAKRSNGEVNLGYGPNYPMYCLSYYDCLDFVEKLNGLTGLTFRMPTEAEWEYAARGGHLSKGYKYPGSNDPLEVAWSDVNAPNRKLREVKLLKPNELGVYDMAGNVWEYIYDYRRTYIADAQVDPLGDINGNKVGIRGGSTAWDTGYNRVSCRYTTTEVLKTNKSSRRAFRFVLDADRVIAEDNTTYQVFDTICAGETYTWNGREYTKPGIYTDTLQNIYGCDSIVELRLEVMPDPALKFTVNGVSFNMMRVRAGSFMMGATEKDTEAEVDEFPRHEVTLTKDFFIGETEMTQELWSAIMGTNPSADKSNPQSPVNMVTWDDCQQMIAKLNELTGLTFRLPTEAEWEYAARGGQYSKGYKYAGSDNIDEVAWYNKSYHTSVASLKPNELGLYDMSGSVYEWCQDYYNPNFYSSPNHQIDPFQAESVVESWCLRGGSNKGSQGVNTKKYSRIANRGHSDGTKVSSSNAWGLRLALEATGILENNSVFVTYDTICSGDAYVWNGKKYYYSGNYVDTLQNIYGCDSIVELHLTVHPSYNKHETVVACGSYEFNPFNIEGGGRILNESGIYSDTVVSVNGCDSIVTLHLTVKPEAVTTTEQVVIGNNVLPYIWRNKEYNETGTYIDAEKYASAECDSAIHVLNLTVLTTGAVDRQSLAVCESELPYLWYSQTLETAGEYTYIEKYAGTTIDSVEHVLNLTVNYSATTAFDTIVCDAYTWEGTTYTASCTDTKTLKTIHGCDSVVTMNLTVNYSTATAFDTIVCDAYTWEGTTYTASCSDTKTLQTVNGCDSVVTMNLTVNYSAATAFDTIVCDVFTWEGTTYTASCSDTKTLQTVNGCDSVVTMNLTVNYSAATAFDTIVCDTYTWEGTTYTASCTDTKTLQTIHGCDSVVTMNLTVNYRDTAYFTETACDSYEWHGEMYTTSGIYYYNTQTVLGCDSVEVLTLTVNYRDTAYFAETACDSYEWHGEMYTTSGIYTYNTQTTKGCDSVEILTLTVNYRDTAYFTETACDSYEWHGELYTTSGIYYYNTQTVLGCDSVEVLTLTVNYRDTAYFAETACDSYEWHGESYTTSGIYYYNTQTVLGCDSVEVLTLTVNYRDTAYFAETVCDSYEWHGELYTTSGIYYYNTQTVLGCDSVEVLTLTVNYRDTAYFTETVCDSYEWHGNSYTTSGVYYYNTQTTKGCDSVEVLTLTINNSVVVPYTVTVCDSYTWSDGNTYTESGVYYDSLQTIHGCDSVEVLTLTINNSVVVPYTVTACDSYTWSDGKTYTASGVYYDSLQTIHGCDSVEVLTLTINNSVVVPYTVTACDSYTWSDGKTYTESGVYYDSLQTIHGCDSVEVLTLTINNSVVVSYTVTACDSYTVPNRYRLYDLYHDVVTIDGHLSGLLDKRTKSVTNKGLTFHDKSGKKVDELDSLINSPQFERFVEICMETLYWGTSAIEFIIGQDFRFEEIDRRHIRPEAQEIATNMFDSKGISIENLPQVMMLGKKNDLGKLLQCSMYALYKRSGFGDFAQYVEIFGQPVRVVKYDAYDTETQKKLRQTLEESGSSLTIMIPKQAEFEMLDGKTSNGNGELQKSLIEVCNQEMSIAILGNSETTTSSNSSGYAQAAVHQSQQLEITQSDLRYICNILNSEQFLNVLASYGYNVLGGAFCFDEEIDLQKLKSRLDIDIQLANKVPISDDYWYETYGIPKPDNYDQLKQEQEERRQAVLESIKQNGKENDKEEDKNERKEEKNATKKQSKLFDQLADFFGFAP